MPKLYTITEVVPKNGFLRYVHYEVLGTDCYPLQLEVGECGRIKYYYAIDRAYHTLRTSVIESVDIADNGDITIITMNTKYVLTKKQYECEEPDEG